MFFVGAARNALGRIDWERSDCAAPSMVEGGPRLHERSPSYAAHHRGRVGSFEACSHASGTHPRQIAGVHPTSNLLGFLGTLNYPCSLLTACGCGFLPSGCASPMLRFDFISSGCQNYTNIEKFAEIQLKTINGKPDTLRARNY